jgi:hypothetical protein
MSASRGRTAVAVLALLLLAFGVSTRLGVPAGPPAARSVAGRPARPGESVALDSPVTARLARADGRVATRRAAGAAARDTLPGATPPGSTALILPGDDDTLPPFRVEATDPQDTTAQPIVFELRVGRLAQRTVQGYRVRTEVLVPLTQFLQMAEVLFALTPEGRLEAVLDPGRRAIVVDASSDTMRYGRRRVRVEREFQRYEDGELYVGAERLGDLLGLRLVVDWSELSVTVADPSLLPIGRRVQREAAREAFLRRRAGQVIDASFGLERASWGGLVLDYSVFLPSVEPGRAGSYTAALGADLFGGSLEAAALSRNGIESGQVRWEGAWTGVWRDSRWLRQLSLGDAVSTGPRFRHVQGLTVTNSPYIRPSLVGTYRYGGRLEPGWVIEAYRGGELVGFDSTDAAGQYGIDLPSYYGENPVDLIAYGPFGEVQEFNRTQRVLSQLLPARRFEYGASAGACRSPLCQATANLDLRYGVSRTWTVRGGLEQLWRDGDPDLTQPYATVTGMPLAGIGVELDAMARGFARAAVNFEPSLNLRVAGDASVYDRSATGPGLTPAGRHHEWGLTGFVRPVPGRPSLYVDASLRHTSGAVGGFTLARAGLSAQANGVRFVPYVRMERATPQGGGAQERAFAGVNVFVLPRPSLGPVLGGFWARADAELQRGAPMQTAGAVVGRELWRDVRLEVGGRYQRTLGGVSLVMTLQTNLPGFRSTTAVDAPPQGDATGSLFVQGSALYNAAGHGVAFTPGNAIERAGLTGRVFVDDNANGRWDAGEAGMAGVRVRVANYSAVSDSSGIFRVWDLIPFEPVPVFVDSLSIESPLVVPAFATATVVPNPNRFRAFDVPLVRSGVVEGRVVLVGEDGERPLPGTGVLLTPRGGGRPMAVLTFSDGGFYVLGVKPGEYDVTVDQRVLDAFGATLEPVRLTVTPAGDVVGPRLLDLRLVQSR